MNEEPTHIVMKCSYGINDTLEYNIADAGDLADKTGLPVLIHDVEDRGIKVYPKLKDEAQ